jgi:ATP-binding cassette subfamily F protein 3
LQALKGYQGTLVFVSHDRYFVDALASRVVEVAAHRATSYLGNYGDFLRTKSSEGDGSHSSLRVEQANARQILMPEQEKASRVVSHAARKAARREEQKRQKEVAEVEARIQILEQELAELTVEMQDPAMVVDHSRLGPLIDRHADLQSELDDCLERWENLQELLAAGGES